MHITNALCIPHEETRLSPTGFDNQRSKAKSIDQILDFENRIDEDFMVNI